MKELELTSNAALTDAVYETALNGSFLEVTCSRFRGR